MQPCTCVDALLHRREGVGDGQVGVVVRVDADHAVEALAHLRADLHQPPRDRAAVGIAQAEHVRAGLLRGFERPQGDIPDCAM